jgi:molybdenum cofactor cytidylyltransferase
MIAAVVLSGGESSRMGRPKALLRIDGDTFIEHIVGALKDGGIERIVVVLGFNADALRREIDRLPVEILVNPDHSRGQLSSLQVAVRHLQAAQNCDGMMVHLVDHPYIDPKLVRLMLDRFEGSKLSIVVPRHQGKRGHPVIFSRSLFDELLGAPMDQGAKAVVNAHRQDTLEIDIDDVGITLDIDTPELYRQHVKGG